MLLLIKQLIQRSICRIYLKNLSSSSKPCPYYVGVGYINSISPFWSILGEYILLWLWQDNHVEASEEIPKKTKVFFSHAADTWEAEFYAKVNDDVYVNLGKQPSLISKKNE